MKTNNETLKRVVCNLWRQQDARSHCVVNSLTVDSCFLVVVVSSSPVALMSLTYFVAFLSFGMWSQVLSVRV